MERGWAQVTTASYDAAAATYSNSTYSYAAYPGLREEVEGFVHSCPDGSLLDVGCGSGRDAVYAASFGRQVVASDASFQMLDELRRRREHESAGIALVQADVASLPFTSDAFAGILASGVLLHLPRAHLSGAVGEIIRVLKPGGLASISLKEGEGEGWRRGGHIDLPRWFSYYQADDVLSRLEQAGFEKLAVQPRRRHPWFTVTAYKPATAAVG
jgi:ubiquinone/menaquinone biosynthesis C-methylase UbiE